MGSNGSSNANTLRHTPEALCDEMGLGKTVQLIATMLAHPKPKPLVIVPKSIVGQWVQEIQRFAPSLSTCAFDGKDRKVPSPVPNIVIVPYSLMTNTCQLLSIHWDRVILDEGHEIRNRKSKTHIACRALQSQIRWVVSGTPIFNSIRDFVALCAFIGIPQDVVQGFTDEVRKKYVLRRTKADVSEFNKRLELPPCDFQNVELEMYAEEKELYRTVFSNGQDMIRHMLKTSTSNMHQIELLECLLRVRQVMTWPQLYLDGIALKEETDPEPWFGGSRKMDELLRMIETHPKEKTIVFTQFMGEMDELQERLVQKNIPVLRIDGSVIKEQREERIARFKTGPVSVFLIQIKAGGVGLNLQEATRVYITSPAWNPATELQAIGRAHRTGQTQKVTVRRLVYVGEETLPSVEQSIVQLQEAKARVCAEVLNDQRIMSQVPSSMRSRITIHALKKIFNV